MEGTGVSTWIVGGKENVEIEKKKNVSGRNSWQAHLVDPRAAVQGPRASTVSGGKVCLGKNDGDWVVYKTLT